MSDTVTLVAGVLLTSVGLLALLPYVLRRGWRSRTGGLAVDSGFSSVLAAVETFAETPQPGPEDDQLPRASVPAEDIEELLAHLFSLRMTVSEIAEEVQEAHEALTGDASDDDMDDEDETDEVLEPAEDVA